MNWNRDFTGTRKENQTTGKATSGWPHHYATAARELHLLTGPHPEQVTALSNEAVFTFYLLLD